jgi:hypothetical protein
VIDALQRAEIVLRHRRAAADQQDRHALEDARWPSPSRNS